MRKYSLSGHRGARARREKAFNLPPVIVGFFFLCCLAYILPSYLLSPAKGEAFTAFFGFIPILFLHNHDVMTQISAVSYSFLHGSFAHLGLNMLWFIIFGTPLANRLGPVFFVLFWLVTAFLAAMVYCLLHRDSDAALIGASGAISGMMGASARYNFQAIGGAYLPGSILPIKKALVSQSVIVVIGSFVALNFLTALDQRLGSFAAGDTVIAWEAHIGGLVSGFLIIGLFDKWTHNFKI